MQVGVALSGGVDSSVCLYLLKEQGFDVFGITIKLTDDYEECENSAIGRSRILCKKLGIEHIVLDWREDFKKEVIDKFQQDIKNGSTPVPCVYCNRTIKLGKLVEFCKKKNAKLATGHYAVNDNRKILMAKDKLKDQTHFLCNIKQEYLQDIMFPLGKMLKSEVFRMAKEKNLIDLFFYKESQEVCFFDGKSYTDYLKTLNLKEVCGDIIYIGNKKKIGSHKGLLKYTIGQRQGLGIAWQEPLYVVNRDFKKNILLVGEEKYLYSTELSVKNVNILVDELKDVKEFTSNVCLRDKTPMVFGTTYIRNGCAKIVLSAPTRAITKGQWCAFYKKDVLVGGGEII